eukprot:10473971-Prorocentrum_lima.AAC.1
MWMTKGDLCPAGDGSQLLSPCPNTVWVHIMHPHRVRAGELCSLSPAPLTVMVPPARTGAHNRSLGAKLPVHHP